MKALVEHLWRENRDAIIERSRLNCHAGGLHSLMLLESPGRTIRCFIAEPEHELWLNTPGTLDQMTVGFHAHHCNITLQVVHGVIRNWLVTPDADGEISTSRFLYRSAITHGGNAGFERQGTQRFHSSGDFRSSVIGERESRSMNAEAIHTVFVAQARTAIWFVFEGRENPDHQPYCYSRAPLDRTTFDHLYIKPGPLAVEGLVQKILSHL